VTRRAVRCPAAAGAAVVVVALLSAARAEQTRVATVSALELPRGEASGMAVSSRGRLFLAPRVTPLGKPLADGDPAQVFAAIGDPEGNLYLATGPDGAIVKVGPTGQASVLFRAEDPLVTALLRQSTGEILAGTAPSGKIYKVRSDGRATVWCETKEHYVWALAPGPEDSVLAATGDRGRLLKIDRGGNASILFDSDEAHLVSLAPAPDGGTWAGSASHGLVYRIDAGGHAAVVYDDDDLPEAKALAVQQDGSLLVALDAAPAPEKRQPSVRIRVAGAGAGAGGDARSELDDRSGSSIQGVIEGLPSRDEGSEGGRLRGKIVRVGPDGTATELWTSGAEAPFSLAIDPAGRPLFATGEPARLWRVEGPGEVALLTTLKEAQATALLRGPRALAIVTSNPEATYTLDRDNPDAGSYAAPPSDAGSLARWGTVSWRAEGQGGRVELQTRSGNSEDPDGTWSPWSPAAVDAEGSPIGSPVGRYLQWRLRIAGGPGEGPRVSAVAATYATRNRTPALRDLRVEPASGSVSAKATFRWSASDPDGDPVVVDVQARKAGSSDWKSASRLDPAPPKGAEPGGGNDGGFKDGRATWDTTAWDEGVYDVRAVASDQGANPAGEGQEAKVELGIPLRIDRTPPAIEAKRVAGGGVEVTVSDAISPVARLEVLEGGRAITAPRPADGVCDGPRETFRLSAADAGPAAARTLRATDAAGNSAEAPVPSP
jgi:sugar lactone lactonase YvrE